MCELCLPRRTVLLGAAGLALGAGAASSVVAAAAAAGPRQVGAPPVVARTDWGPDLAPTGPIPDEPDVRFLLVHHTVNTNDYAPEQVVDLLTSIYRFHTSAERGWPDIAYNFLIDRFGTVYEGRTGSLAGAKAADATGGSQGFAQLCSFIGDHSTAAPTDAALASMVAMLGFLGDRHGLDLSPGATTTFVSRGSNRRPAGEEVITPTISGHRDMSQTACPGDAAYALVADGTFARLATEARSPTTTTPAPTPTEPPPATTTTTAPPPAPPPTDSAAAPPPSSPAPPRGDVQGDDLALPAAIAATAAAAATAGVLALRRRTQG